MIQSNLTWNEALSDSHIIWELEQNVLPKYLQSCRWYAGKAKNLQKLIISNHIEMAIENDFCYLCILTVQYDSGESERYFLPLGFLNSFKSTELEVHPKGIITEANFGNNMGQLVDATYTESFQQALFQSIAHNETVLFQKNKVIFTKGIGLEVIDTNTPISSRILLVEQSNSSVIFGEKYFMKLYRKLFDETNPEVEMVAFLSEKSSFTNLPAFAGSMAWQQEGYPEITLGMMQKMVENQTDAWTVTGSSLNKFIMGFLAKEFTISENIFDEVELLAKRTAEMHLGLYAPHAEKEFSPDKFDEKYRQFLFTRINKLLDSRYGLVMDSYTKMDPETQKLAWDFMEAKEMIDEFLEQISSRELGSLRTRIHGDYHLGQVLATDQDYTIIDFEGEPESTITDRKIKHSPLKDVAGMLRSYHYAISAKFFNDEKASAEATNRKAKAADRWYGLIQKTFLEKYFSTFGNPHPLFKNNTEINFLLLVYLLEKAVYELGYEVSYRPDWVKIPLKGIVDVIREIEKLRK